MRKLYCVFIPVLLVVLALPAFANNTFVGEPILTGYNTTDDYVFVQFDLSWDNSFRDGINWDAVWVFVKYKVTVGEWNHATLNTSGHSVTTDNGVAATIDTPSDGKGVFLYRTNQNSGSINWDGVKLRWNYGADGVSDDATVTIKVFAIEMVYVPQGAFYVGDADNDQTNCFHDGDDTGPYYVISEGAITVGTGNGELYYDRDNVYAGDRGGPIPADFPKGYAAFYCMKYEISQGQYADFLNTLAPTQASNRYPDQNENYRHTISGSYPIYSASRPDRACNYLSWADGTAYADWSGLRPMTELEFEKACRGDQAVVDDEYTWGANTIVADAPLAISGSEDGTETITTDVSNGACCYGSHTHSGGDGGQGPLRCGIFATSTTSRTSSGASYYGIMELSGNLWERPVTVGNSDGRGFTGANGDCSLSSSGDANVSNWPGTDAVGSGYRGGSWLFYASNVCVSDRSRADIKWADRFYNTGFRCVRSEP